MNVTNNRAMVEAMDRLLEQNNGRPRCCCGRPDCAYLLHNNTALGGLEKDLATAAKLGQALLSRHESYVSESQVEHARMSTYITEIEAERTSLQHTNEKIVAENKELLSQLESLNTNLATGDQEVKRLEDLLLNCELELKRLGGLVRRTGELDDRLQKMELENITLNKQAEESREEARNTITRWRESERQIRELEEDVKRIERDARLDRERHEEIVARLEKERLLEREFGGAEGRLKGAAAVRNMSMNGTGPKTVVSHFVKDILQDNANLQAGVAELRDMLQASNDEVQNLREQIMLHQPLDEEEHQDTFPRLPSLEEQMAPRQSSPRPPLQQEVHVHHHYHAKLAKKERNTSVRRPSRRRAVVPAYGYTSEGSIPSTPISGPQRYVTSPGPMSLYHPQPTKNRWSLQSASTNSTFLSSMPSSPRSYFDRGGSLFDRLERGEESSRPTSPESVGDSSPERQKVGFRLDEPALDDFEEESLEETLDMPPLEEEEEPILDESQEEIDLRDEDQLKRDLTPKPSLVLSIPADDIGSATATILEPCPPDEDIHSKEPNSIEELLEPAPEAKQISDIRPSLTARASHESLVSISGMDIHIAKRPSSKSTLKLLGGNSAYFAQTPLQPRKLSATQPLASVTEYTVLSSVGFESSPVSAQTSQPRSLGIEALSGIAVPPSKASKGTSPSAGGLGRLVGGWVRGKWGVAPTKSVADLGSVSADQGLRTVSSSALSGSNNVSVESMNSHSNWETAPARESARERPAPTHAYTAPSALEQGNGESAMSLFFAGRSPGINQPGMIPGFRAAAMSRRTPSQIQAATIDEEDLRECLAE